MGLSVVTLALARKHAVKVAQEKAVESVKEAVQKAVHQSNEYTDNKISEAGLGYKIKFVEVLPTEDIDSHTIYFLKDASTGEEGDTYSEYIYYEGDWKKIGDTKLDLTNYWSIQEIKDYIDSLNLGSGGTGSDYELPRASYSQLGGVIVSQGNGLNVSNGYLTIDYNFVYRMLDKQAFPMAKDDILSVVGRDI